MANLGMSASHSNVFYFKHQAEILLDHIRASRNRASQEKQSTYEQFYNRLFDVPRPLWNTDSCYPSTPSHEWKHWCSDAGAGGWVMQHFPDLHVGDEFWAGIDCVGNKPNHAFGSNPSYEQGHILYFIEIKSRGWDVSPGWRRQTNRKTDPGVSTSITIGLNQLEEFQEQYRQLKAGGLPSLNEHRPYMRCTSAFFYYLFMFSQRMDNTVVGRQVYLVRPHHFLYDAEGRPRPVSKGRRGGSVSVSRRRLNDHVDTGELVKCVDEKTLYDGNLTYVRPAHGSFPFFSVLPLGRRRSVSTIDTEVEAAFEPEEEYAPPPF